MNKVKTDEVKIISITSSMKPDISDSHIFGLGDDGIVYQWAHSSGRWEKFSLR